MNEGMGTGTDFPTAAPIEINGGLVLVIGIKPTNTGVFSNWIAELGAYLIKDEDFMLSWMLNIMDQAKIILSINSK
jgi:hypothetical protein